MSRGVYFLSINSWAVYVKEGEFFKEQGGLVEDWGKGWHPVIAESIEDARAKGEAMLNAWRAQLSKPEPITDLDPFEHRIVSSDPFIMEAKVVIDGIERVFRYIDMSPGGR